MLKYPACFFGLVLAENPVCGNVSKAIIAERGNPSSTNPCESSKPHRPKLIVPAPHTRPTHAIPLPLTRLDIP